MDTTISNIVSFHRPQHTQAAEREKTLGALKYRIAVATLDRLRQNKEITDREFEIGCAFLAKRFHQSGFPHEPSGAGRVGKGRAAE